MSALILLMKTVGLVSSPIKDAVGSYEPFSVQYKVQMPQESNQGDAIFLQKLEEKEPYLPFVISSIHTNAALGKAARTYTFSLLPKS